MHPSKKTIMAFSTQDIESYILTTIEIDKNYDKEDIVASVEILILSQEQYSAYNLFQSVDLLQCHDSENGSGSYSVFVNQPIKHLKSSSYGHFNATLTNNKRKVTYKYVIPEKSQYHVLIGMCHRQAQDVYINSTILAINHYGHLPGTLHGFLSFSHDLLLLYSIMAVFWLYRCYRYRSELMRIHLLILVLIISIIVQYYIRINDLTVYNRDGVKDNTMDMRYSIITIFVNTFIHCLLLFLANGVGITKASLGCSSWLVFLELLVYFGTKAFCYISNTPHIITQDEIMLMSLIDVVMFTMIMRSLYQTMNELEEKKQTSKLLIFKYFNRILSGIVIFSLLYCLFYNYMIQIGLYEQLWQYRWFFKEAVWDLVQCIIILSILNLWSPNDRFKAYAYHVQVATDEMPDPEEYAMPEVDLHATAEGKIEVASIDKSRNLQPMKM